ncbi:class I SAM-dependent methyltransferase [Mesorhizobium shangrilense]|uniref:Class I SAM-dependent methyltransferase n=1 Tax=Mesorhizobium shangrilense TaxID=460060 RepID=A0ABV2D6S2_9HYPH
MPENNTIDFDRALAAAEFVCPACRDSNLKARVLRVDAMSLYRCGQCASLIYDPFPSIDYTAHTSPLGIRNYVEMSASIDTVARNILRVVPDGSIGRILDIGCGFGFALDAVRTIAGWEAMGFEPSQYGGSGRDQLGLDIIRDFAPLNPNPHCLYNVVHCSEVIEHIHDPAAFLAILTSYLSEDGVIVLTTPNPERINPTTARSTLLALLSPGAHTILFSDEALTRLFEEAGLTFVAVDKSADSTLFYASRRPIEFQTAEGWQGKILFYLKAALSRAQPGSSLAVGLRYRLFRAAIDHGMYEIAEQSFDPILADARPRVDDISSLTQFAGRWPLCIAASTYYRGMLLLIHRGDYMDAAEHLHAAHLLCAKKIEIDPATAGVEADLVWRAKYHEALSLENSGQHRKAMSALDAIDGRRLAEVPQDLEAGIAELRKTIEASQPVLNAASASFFRNLHN